MSEKELLFEIVDALAEHGLACDDYQLQQFVAVEALEQLVDSADPHTELEVRFSVGERRVLVTPAAVTVFGSS